MRIEEIISLLEGRPMSVREICAALNLEPTNEREVIEALKRASRVLKRKGKQLLMMPARCRECGFEFESMSPSKCPNCKSEWIEPAKFYIYRKV